LSAPAWNTRPWPRRRGPLRDASCRLLAKRVADKGGSAGEPSAGTPGVKGVHGQWGILPVLPQVPETEARYDRRRFVGWPGSLPLVGRYFPPFPAPPVTIDASPTPLYQQPDGRRNLVRITVARLGAPAARAAVTARPGP